jgi:hypothetical protein
MTADPRRATPLKNIGDEAFLLDEGSYSKETFNVVFRKGKVRMNVTAASADMAQRFARLFADAVPAAQQGVAPEPPRRVLKGSFHCSARPGELGRKAAKSLIHAFEDAETNET